MSNIVFLGYGAYEPPLAPVVLTYSTSEITNSDPRVLTATPNPDPTGNTGYFSIPNARGVTLDSSSNFRVEFVSDQYPNYQIRATLQPQYMGNQSGILTTTVRDYEGNLGTTSGIISLSRSRNFTWNALTTFSPNVQANQKLIMFVDSLDYLQFRIYDEGTNDYSIPVQANRSFYTPMETGASSTVRIYNEVMFEHISGNTGWYVTDIDNLNSATKSKGVYYDLYTIALASNRNNNPSSTLTSVIRITFRNKQNTSITFTQQITVNIVRS